MGYNWKSLQEQLAQKGWCDWSFAWSIFVSCLVMTMVYYSTKAQMSCWSMIYPTS